MPKRRTKWRLKYHRAVLEAELRKFAELDRFWVYFGLIHYLDSVGKPSILMDDDDGRVDVCIELLESIGRPVFDDETAMNKYVEDLQARLNNR